MLKAFKSIPQPDGSRDCYRWDGIPQWRSITEAEWNAAHSQMVTPCT